MNKFSFRLITLLLIPCLATEPALANSGFQKPSQAAIPNHESEIFQAQTLAPVIASVRPGRPWSRGPIGALTLCPAEGVGGFGWDSGNTGTSEIGTMIMAALMVTRRELFRLVSVARALVGRKRFIPSGPNREFTVGMLTSAPARESLKYPVEQLMILGRDPVRESRFANFNLSIPPTLQVEYLVRSARWAERCIETPLGWWRWWTHPVRLTTLFAVLFAIPTLARAAAEEALSDRVYAVLGVWGVLLAGVIAMAVGMQGRPSDEETALRKKLATSPLDAALHLELANLLMKRNATEAASDHYWKAIMWAKNNPSVKIEAMKGRAKLLLAWELTLDALALTRDIMKETSQKDLMANFLRLRALQQGLIKRELFGARLLVYEVEAEAIFKKNQGNVAIRNAYAELLIRLGRNDYAKIILEETLSHKPDNPEARKLMTQA